MIIMSIIIIAIALLAVTLIIIDTFKLNKGYSEEALETKQIKYYCPVCNKFQDSEDVAEYREYHNELMEYGIFIKHEICICLECGCREVITKEQRIEQLCLRKDGEN